MANEKILVVDDDTNICELLRLYLTKEGYQVTTANDGEEGLDKFNQVKPDMVLLDVMMPKMDGLEVCRRIRKLGNTPVMMLTAKGETFDKVLGLELGADDYMAAGHPERQQDVHFQECGRVVPLPEPSAHHQPLLRCQGKCAFLSGWRACHRPTAEICDPEQQGYGAQGNVSFDYV